jgi:thiamine transport system ATP-binding protein
MLDLAGISVRFGQRLVLDRVSAHVGRGEVVALLGESGSGKSTLLRVAAGLLTPDAGTVRIDGNDVTSLPTHRRNVGLVFQDEQLFPHLDVAGNIGFGLRMHGVDAATRRARVDELLDLVGMPGSGGRRVGRLSGGEAKRVALARSMAPRPAVLLLDEPLTGLDRDLHDRLAGELARILRADGTTALLVTHDPQEAATIADRTLDLTTLAGSTGAGPGGEPADPGH